MSPPANTSTHSSAPQGPSSGAKPSSMKDMLLKMEHRMRQQALNAANIANSVPTSVVRNTGNLHHKAPTEGVGTDTREHTGPPPGLPHPPAYRSHRSVVAGDGESHSPVTDGRTRFIPTTFATATDDLVPDKTLHVSKPRDQASSSKKATKGKPAAVVVVEDSPSDTSSEELANRPLDPGDSVYRAGKTKSRVDPGDAGRAFSPPVTRRTARLQSAVATLSSSTDKTTSTFVPTGNGSSPPLVRTIEGGNDTPGLKPPKPRPRQVKRALPDDSDTAQNPPTSESKETPLHKKSRLHRQTGGPDEGTIDGIPQGTPINSRHRQSCSNSFSGMRSGSSNSTPAEQSFVDLEAEEDGAEEGSGDEVTMEVDENSNEYDLNDPFIDDGPQGSESRRLSSRPNTHETERSIASLPGKERISPERISPGPDIMASDFSGFDSADDPWLASFFKKFKERRRKMKLRQEQAATQSRAVTHAGRSTSLSKKGKARARIMSDDDGNHLPVHEFPDEPGYNSMSDSERRAILQAVQASRAERAGQGRAGESSHSAIDASVPNAGRTSGAPGALGSAPPTPSTPSSSASTNMPNLFGTITPSQFSASPATSPPSPSPGTTRRCTGLPDRCEVNDPSLQDPVLAGVYNSLPPLKAGHLVPWSDMPGPGQVFFSAWGDQCPHMNGLSALSALSLVDDGNFTNPSRSLPVNTEVREVPGGRFHLYRDGNPLVGVSPVFLEQSQLLTPSVSGLTQKYVRGIMHTQEWERFVSWTCMAFGHQTLSAQLAKDALQFSTRPRFESKDDNKKKSNGMFKNTRSPSTRSNLTPNRVTADTFALPTDGIVPIYDARNSNFDFGHDLPNVANLPRWDQEIPYGSFVVVGYTLAVYRAKGGNWTLGCNIQWAVIVGVPAEDA